MRAWMRIHQKRALIQKAADYPTMTQVELAAWAKLAFKLKRAPAQTTISNVLKKAPIILSEAYGDGKRRKPLKVTSLALEELLWAWIQQVEAQNVCFSRELIKMKALDLQKELCDAWELTFSDGWLTGFERRHGLRDRQRYGEAASADPTAVQLGRQPLQDLSDQYAPPDIYNMDETGMCYAMAPSRSICTRGARGVKKNKTRITLALTANSDGSDALPPLFLGRAMQPRCFKKRTADQLGFEYKANQKAWMTGQVFRQWLRKLDRDMRAAGRHILLLVDNTPSHSIGDTVCTTVRLEFLPPNTTAFLQQMDAGIIASFKRAYRRKQLRWVYNKAKSGATIDKDVYKVDQLHAMRWSKEIWEDLQNKRTIENCYRHTGIVFNGVDERDNGDSNYGVDVAVEDVIIRTSQLSL